jgi:hypothetical protein
LVTRQGSHRNRLRSDAPSLPGSPLELRRPSRRTSPRTNGRALLSLRRYQSAKFRNPNEPNLGCTGQPRSRSPLLPNAMSVALRPKARDEWSTPQPSPACPVSPPTKLTINQLIPCAGHSEDAKGCPPTRQPGSVLFPDVCDARLWRYFSTGSPTYDWRALLVSRQPSIQEQRGSGDNGYQCTHRYRQRLDRS